MSLIRRIGVLAIVASLAFSGAFLVKSSRAGKAVAPRAAVPADAPDSVKLAALGIHPGRQLVAYLFGSSRCGYCQQSDTKRAFGAVGRTLRTVHGAAYPTISVVGVAVNTDIPEGLSYLSSIGLRNFDELSVGDGWRNEHITRWIRRERAAEPAVPLVIVVSRTMRAKLAPLSLDFGPDSVLTVLQGHQAIIDWVARGTPLTRDTSRPRDSTQATREAVVAVGR